MATLRIAITFGAGPRQAAEAELVVPLGSSALQAIESSGLLAQYPALQGELVSGHCTVGIWGKPVAMGQLLCSGDRIEIYRPLRVDPKRARRERYARQGSAKAGLFAKPKK